MISANRRADDAVCKWYMSRVGLVGIALVSVLAGCKGVPLPPFVAPLGGTAAEDTGATTGMLVLGMAGGLGGGGVGLALRLEQQRTDHTTYGLELTAGRGDRFENEGGDTFRQFMVGARAYSRTQLDVTKNVALTYGAGLSLTATGALTATLHGGGETAYTNDYWVPYLALSGALAVPLLRGRAAYERTWGVGMMGNEPLPGRPRGLLDPPAGRRTRLRPSWDCFVIANVGFVVPVGHTGNRIAADLGGALSLRTPDLIVSLSAADAQRNDD